LYVGRADTFVRIEAKPDTFTYSPLKAPGQISGLDVLSQLKS